MRRLFIYTKFLGLVGFDSFFKKFPIFRISKCFFNKALTCQAEISSFVLFQLANFVTLTDFLFVSIFHFFPPVILTIFSSLPDSRCIILFSSFTPSFSSKFDAFILFFLALNYLATALIFYTPTVLTYFLVVCHFFPLFRLTRVSKNFCLFFSPITFHYFFIYLFFFNNE